MPQRLARLSGVRLARCRGTVPGNPNGPFFKTDAALSLSFWEHVACVRSLCVEIEQ